MSYGAILYSIGLIIAALCVGELFSAVYGFLVIAIGTMTLGTVVMLLNYLNNPPREGLTMKSRGFTLIELMVIMAVIGILAVIIVGAARTDHERNAAKAEAEYTVTASEQAAVRAHTAGHDYTNRAYFKEVILNVSADFQPVCVHGIPGFIVKRGVNQGEFVQLRDYRGYKAAQRFWMACQDMGGELVKKHENE